MTFGTFLNRRGAFRALLSFGIGVLGAGGVARGGDVAWTNSAGGAFETPGNWSPATVPADTDNAIFDLPASTYTVTFNSDPVNQQALVHRGVVSFELNGHPYSLGENATQQSLGVATSNGDDATLTVRGGATIGGVDTLVGSAATSNGRLIIDQPNTDLFLVGSLYIGGGSGGGTGGTGLVRLQDGGRVTISNGANVFQGGTLELSSGGISAHNIVLDGGRLSSSGEVEVSADIDDRGILAPREISVSGDVNMGQAAKYIAAIFDESTAGHLQVDGNVALDGQLLVQLAPGLADKLVGGESFSILGATSVGGTFDNMLAGSRVATSDHSGTFLVTYNADGVVLSDFESASNGGGGGTPIPLPPAVFCGAIALASIALAATPRFSNNRR